MKRRGKRRAMRIVPRVVFGTICAGVIPAVAVSCDDPAGCTGPGCSQANAHADAPLGGDVASECFGPGCFAVAAQCFDGSTAVQCQQADAATDGRDGDAADAPDAHDG
jgi:hypothetical protein